MRPIIWSALYYQNYILLLLLLIIIIIIIHVISLFQEDKNIWHECQSNIWYSITNLCLRKCNLFTVCTRIRPVLVKYQFWSSTSFSQVPVSVKYQFWSSTSLSQVPV